MAAPPPIPPSPPNKKGCLLAAAILGFVFLSVAVLLGLRFKHLTSLPPEYQAQGKLVCHGRMFGPRGEPDVTREDFATVMEIIKSSELRTRANERVMALHPNLKPNVLRLQVMRPMDSNLIMVSAIGKHPDYTKHYVNALLDELIFFRRELAEQSTEITLNSITDELLRLEKSLKENEESLADFLEKNSPPLLKKMQEDAAAHFASLNRKKLQLEAEAKLFTSDPDTMLLDLRNLANRIEDSPIPEDPSGENEVAVLP